MKKKLLCYLTSLFTVLLFLSSCQKEISTDIIPIDKQDPGSEENIIADRSGNGKCRLTEFLDSDGLSETYHYNRRGLCDEWIDPSLGILKQEYNAAGRLVKSRWYDGDELLYTIHFFYTGKNVTKEIWYVGDSKDIDDKVFYKYNRRGQNTRMQSFMADYYTDYKYDATGNVIEWNFYSGGFITYSSLITFNRHRNYNNPRNTITGIEYGFPFLNGAIFADPYAIASEKSIAYDESGNPTVLYEYDPRRTRYQPASQNYPASGLFFDLVSNDWYSQTFEYENCGHRDNVTTDKKEPATSAMKTQPRNKQLMMKVMSSRGKDLKENIKLMRKQLSTMKKN